VEFAFLADLDLDGKARELLPQFGNTSALAWYEIKTAVGLNVVSPNSYGHGIVQANNGRSADPHPKGWFECPADPRDGQWTWHPDFDWGRIIHAMISTAMAAMIVTSLAHYGIFWMEHGAGGGGRNTC